MDIKKIALLIVMLMIVTGCQNKSMTNEHITLNETAIADEVITVNGTSTKSKPNNANITEVEDVEAITQEDGHISDTPSELDKETEDTPVEMPEETPDEPLETIELVIQDSINPLGIKLDTPDMGINVTILEQTANNKIDQIESIDINKLKELFYTYADYTIVEESFEILVNLNYVTFTPKISGINLSRTYSIYTQEGYVTSLIADPMNFTIPDTFNTDTIVSQKLCQEEIRQLHDEENIEISGRLFYDSYYYGSLVYLFIVRNKEGSQETMSEKANSITAYLYDALTGKFIRYGY